MWDLCLTLAAHSQQELNQRIAEYAGSVSYIEVRLDCLDEPCLPELPRYTPTRFLATHRPQRQGGHYKGSEVDRLALLQAAGEHGFSWIDLENDVPPETLLPPGISVVRSFHSFEQFPDDLDSVLEDLRNQRGDVFKIAVQVSTSSELKRLLLWMESLPPSLSRTVIGMGRLGRPSRLLSKFLGNALTYVSASEEEPAAPGQFPLNAARDLYRLDHWQSVPELYGVIGNPVDDLLPVRIHNRLFEHYHREALCIPLELDDVEPWFDYMGATQLQFEGLGVAAPFETIVGSHIDSLSTISSRVDTLKREGPRWIGLSSAATGQGQERVLEQTARQFYIWTGIDPDRSLIREVFDA